MQTVPNKLLIIEVNRSESRRLGEDLWEHKYKSSAFSSYENINVSLADGRGVIFDVIACIEYSPVYLNFPIYDNLRGHYFAYIKVNRNWYKANDWKMNKQITMSHAIPKFLLLKMRDEN